jgi:hypothetical protein
MHHRFLDVIFFISWYVRFILFFLDIFWLGSLGNSFYLFGGRTPNGKLHDDLFLYNRTNMLWTHINSFNLGPSPRFGHSSVAIHNSGTPSFVVFGGILGQFVDSVSFEFD